MRRFDKSDLYCGLLMILIGAGVIGEGLNYQIGTLARMGPGYFPLMLGILLALVGGLIMMPSAKPQVSDSHQITRSQIRVWGLVTLGLIAFVVLGHYAGLVPATFVLIFITALADQATLVKAAALLALGVTLAAVVIFHYGLQMQFPLFRWG